MAAVVGHLELQGLPNRLIRFFARFPPQIYSARVTGVQLPFTRGEAKHRRIAEAAAEKRAERAQQDAAEQAQSATSTTQSIAADGTVVIDATGSPSSLASQPRPSKSVVTTAVAADPDSDGNITESSITRETTTTPSSESPLTLNGRVVDGLSRASRFPSNPFLPFKNPGTGNWASPKYSLREQGDLCKLARAHKIEDLLPPSRKSSAFKQARLLERGLRIKGTGKGERVRGKQWERDMPELLERRREALEKMPVLVREWQARGHGKGWKAWPKAKAK